MKIFGIEIKRAQAQLPAPEEAPQDAPQQPNESTYRKVDVGAMFGWAGSGQVGYASSNSVIMNIPYTGETNIGEMGPVRRYTIDHVTLKERAWQMYLENDLCHTVIDRKKKWVVGAGLKLQSSPQIDVLEMEGIAIKDPEKWTKRIEARWRNYANTVDCDWTEQKTLDQLSNECYHNVLVAGDILVVLRYIDNVLKVQHIDATHISTPFNFSMAQDAAKLDNYIGYEFTNPENGNRVRWGVEIDERGRTVAYHVRVGNGLQFERVQAKNASGLLMAFIVSGSQYRIDTTRGIPGIAPNMEGAKQLSMYKEAVITGTVERAKIPYVFEHEIASDGTHPMSQSLTKMKSAVGAPGPNDDLPVTNELRNLANTVASTENKMVLNMPQGVKAKALESKQEINFSDFYGTNVELECANFGIPPEVAMMKYEGSFSSSRAGLKDFEHSLRVDRGDFSIQYHQRIYNVWFHIEVLKLRIDAPGYLDAFDKNDTVVVNAYRCARWVGASVPHIDPLKEVNAERAKLGTAGAHLPLTSLEASTEALDGGNANENMRQFGAELEEAESYGITSELDMMEDETKEEPKEETEG